ncbi:glucosyl-3-phosphoglycerate synthase [Aeromicrobium sp.]|uniref:glucosyl-3-phosphoglycerate synthase n=1 Tax=Aeromicrobium sp. TaxID=1871063 RepID=UPI0028AE500A|nr:glucosyl-3-phosphoglycerate synthase [Aeromicrobium sp.]
MADTWFDRHTHVWSRWRLDELMKAKQASGSRVSLVVPARNEAATIGDVVGRLHAAFVAETDLVDELVVIDGDSTDDTARIAREAGGVVHELASVRPDLGTRPGKGESLWKAQFVTTGDVLVFVDADLVEWDTHFVTGLLGPLLTDPATALVKGFYQRPFRSGSTNEPHGGGRVTELVARPLLAIARPQLTQVVQPLAGEWAVRRDVFATLSVPVGYGVDIAALMDVHDRLGPDAIAQVDLGVRAHSHQDLADLAPMAAQVMAAVLGRSGHDLDPAAVLRQFVRQDGGLEQVARDTDLSERPPANEVAR